MEVGLEPITFTNIELYISIGIQSYKEHYLHLWKNRDPSPFINAHLTKEVVLEALKDPNQLFYLIQTDGINTGILNLTLDSRKEKDLSKQNILLNKIYILKSYSGKGIGGKTLELIHTMAKKMQKDVVWLYAMKKGKPLHFYQKYHYTIVKESYIELPNVLETEKEMWLMQLKLT